MALIKCKMCGGDLHIAEGSTVCECEYCGSRQTIPTVDNEKKMTLFTRASRLLRNCEFDKASGVFETIVAEFPEEAEAYWGLVLCKYGIEYVDDPATGKKVPTCHRSSFDSVMDDPNFEQACENTDAVARRVYRDEARQIEALRLKILEVSGKEEPYDVFISYKEKDENGERTRDSVIAQNIYKALTGEEYRVFFSRISLESKLGTEYEPYIFAALNSARVMLVVGTDYENFDSVWVKNEWSRFLKLIASGQKKTLIPVFKDMDAYDMPREFSKFAAQDMGKIGAMQDLVHGVEKFLGTKEKESPASPVQVDSGLSAMNAQTEAMLKRGYMMLSDGDYAKADEFFEKVLNNDAESGQAYWGKTLAAAKVPDAEQFGSVILFNRMNSNNMYKTVKLPQEDLAILAREADEEGALKSFSDQELRDLLRDLARGPVCYQTAKEYYQGLAKQYSDTPSLHKLAQSKDYQRAAQYADATVRGYESTALNSLQERLGKTIAEEEKKEYAAEQEAENSRKQTVSTIRSRLRSVEADHKRLQNEMEAAQREAERKADQDYRDAMSRFEEDYQAAVARQEANYQLELEDWQRKKTAFEKEYATAVKEGNRLEEKVRQLTTERDRLTGLFTGKKRRELEDNIALLKKKLDGIVIPEDPGPKPEKAPGPKKGTPPRKEDFKVSPASGASADLRETIKCSLSSAYKNKYMQYQEAAFLYASGDYAGAYKNYLLLTGYKDVDKLLSTDKNLLAASASAAREAKLKSYKTVGSTVCFGAYEQDNNIDNGKENIEWIVLKNEGNKSLLISKYALDTKPYNSAYMDLTWETCTLRRWLNSTFLDTAFSTDEKTAILTTTVDNSKSQGNSDWSTSGGNNTIDQIFLLSYAEAGKYFSKDSDRICKPSAYVKGQGAYTNDRGNCYWWLRSHGSTRYNVAFVSADGSLSDLDGVYNKLVAVRAALWINLESDIF